MTCWSYEAGLGVAQARAMMLMKLETQRMMAPAQLIFISPIEELLGLACFQMHE